MKLGKITYVILATAFNALAFTPDPALSYYIPFNSIYTGDMPSLSAPWGYAMFMDDNPTDNQAWLSIAMINLTSTEFISKTFFNYNPSPGYATSLTITPVDQVGSVVTTVNPYSQNAYKAGGSYLFDIELDYPTANNDNTRFQNGEEVLYKISGENGSKIKTSDFLNQSVKKNSTDFGPIGAFHVQGIKLNRSGWGGGNDYSNIPESEFNLLLSGLGLIGVSIWRKFRK